MPSQIEQLLAEATKNSIPEERAPSVAPSLTFSEDSDDQDELQQPEPQPPKRRRASTRLIAQSPADIQRITGESTQQLINRCCGGGCCMNPRNRGEGVEYETITVPDNDAFRSLSLRVDDKVPTVLTNITDLPEQTTFLGPVRQPSTLNSPGSLTIFSAPWVIISISSSLLAAGK